MISKYFKDKIWADIPEDSNPVFDYISNTYTRKSEAVMVYKASNILYVKHDKDSHVVIFVPKEGKSKCISYLPNYELAEIFADALLKAVEQQKIDINQNLNLS